MSDVSIYINQIKLIRKIIDNGFSINLGDVDDELFIKSLEHYSNKELLELSKSLKDKINKNSIRANSPYKMELKFCIGKCEREYIPNNGLVEIYCPSCDRTILKRPIKI